MKWCIICWIISYQLRLGYRRCNVWQYTTADVQTQLPQPSPRNRFLDIGLSRWMCPPTDAVFRVRRKFGKQGRSRKPRKRAHQRPLAGPPARLGGAVRIHNKQLPVSELSTSAEMARRISPSHFGRHFGIVKMAGSHFGS